MAKFGLYLIFCIFNVLSIEGRAAEWGVGTVLGQGSGLSLQYREDEATGFHFSGRVEDEDRMSLELVHQQFYYPQLFGGKIMEFYSGVGMEGQADRYSDHREQYRLALLFGVQWEPMGFPLQVFADQAGLLGPLPFTSLYGRLQVGLRAVF